MAATDYEAVHLPALTARYGFPIAVTSSRWLFMESDWFSHTDMFGLFNTTDFMHVYVFCMDNVELIYWVSSKNLGG